MSTSRLSRCATESKIARGDLAQGVEQEVHHPIGRVVGEAGAVGDRDPFGHPAGGGQLAARFQRPLCHQREQHPLGRVGVQAPVAATRCSAAPTPSRSQSWSSTHAPPTRRESRISISPVCAAVIACCGSRNREIEATSRASASRSTASARPKLWITFAEHPGDRVAFAVRQLQIRHRRTVAVASLRLPQVHPYTTST